MIPPRRDTVDPAEHWHTIEELRRRAEKAEAEAEAAMETARYAAETHAGDLAVIAASLGMPGAGAGRVDAGAVWWRARSAWLALKRNGLDAEVAANDGGERGRATPAAPPDAERDPIALCRELARLRAFVRDLGALDVPCTCGSGGHPRACSRHPWGMALHVAEMNAEQAADTVAELARAGEEIESLRAVVAAVRREHDARAEWLAALPQGACTSPPPRALLDAEAAAREALRGLP